MSRHLPALRARHRGPCYDFTVMRLFRTFSAPAVLIATMWLLQPVSAQEAGTTDGPGWTGVTKPMDVIAARQALMLELEQLMLPIDTYTVDQNTDSTLLAPAAQSIAPMLLAFPHLFPPTTDLYDAEAELPVTLALPRIWQEFDAFYAMSAASSAAATALAEMSDAESLQTASTGLRASCDACHALYLRPYVRSTVTEEDLDFDFDSLFGTDDE